MLGNVTMNNEQCIIEFLTMSFIVLITKVLISLQTDVVYRIAITLIPM